MAGTMPVSKKLLDPAFLIIIFEKEKRDALRSNAMALKFLVTLR
jgi:hypothetical protein